jgi:hypothetical protein
MMAARYKTKKALKESIGKDFRYEETSLFGEEWKADVMLTVVGPSAYERKWYANVWVNKDNVIQKVK